MTIEQVVREWIKKWNRNDKECLVWGISDEKANDLISKLSGFVSREEIIEILDNWSLKNKLVEIDGLADTEIFTSLEIKDLKSKFMPEPSKGGKDCLENKCFHAKPLNPPLESSGTKDDLKREDSKC